MVCVFSSSSIRHLLGVGEPEVVVVDRVLLLLLLMLPAVNIMLCFVIVVVPKCAVQ